MTEPQAALVDAVLDIVDKQLKFTEHGYALGPQDSLWDLGMTSLNTVGLMLAVEDAFAIEFPDELLNERSFHSVASIAKAIESVRARVPDAAGTTVT